MSVLLLIVFVFFSYIIVRVGAIALELTGMEKDRARFQSLSAFTGTGFTTGEAELVVNHPRRRKIITYLMILGNAGIVSVIATFVLSLRASGIFRPSLKLLIIAGSMYVLYRILSKQSFTKRLSDKIRQVLRERYDFEKVQVEEVLRQADGYGIASIVIGIESRVVGQTLGKSGFTERDLLVLSVESDEGVTPVPKADTTIRVGDRLILYGKLEAMKELV